MIGNLQKMQGALVGSDSLVRYVLRLGDQAVPLNEHLGKIITLKHTGNIHCCYCQRAIKKTFNQGYCFPCFRSLARCDSCIVRPEQCHFHLGTCREPQWGQSHCMQSHIVYLANTSGCKVGITRAGQVPTRWIDQGAVQALPIFEVQSRLQSGLVEVALAQFVSDKTHWQRMLRGVPERIDLIARRDALLQEAAVLLQPVLERFGEAITPLSEAAVVDLVYPVQTYPEKVKSLSLDRTPVVSGQLLGIKGQYLILDTGVINIRKFTGYEVEWD